MFKQEYPLQTFHIMYNYKDNEIDSVLEHFLKGEPEIVLPSKYEDLLKIRETNIPIKITGNHYNATVEYLRNPNYDINKHNSSAYNLIKIREERTEAEVLKKIIKINNPDTSGILIIQILEYGEDNDIYFTEIEYNKDPYDSTSIGLIKSSYFNSDTFNYFKGQETDFDIFSNLEMLGIFSDDEEESYVEKKEDLNDDDLDYEDLDDEDLDDEELEDNDENNCINLVLDKYDETIKTIEERNRSRSLKRGSHV